MNPAIRKTVFASSQAVILLPTDGMVYCEFDKGGFITLHAPTKKTGAGLYLSEIDTESAPEWIEALVKQGLGWVKEDRNALQIKVIAPAGKLEYLQQVIQSTGVGILNMVATKLPFVVVYFDIESGKIQLGEFRSKNERQVLAGSSDPKKEPGKRIRVLMVDDSRASRQILRRMLSDDPVFEIVAEAEHPKQVEALIQQHKPDLMTLDINLPEMDGVTLLEQLFPKYRTPTVMVTAISAEEGNQVFRALEIGAVDYIEKPSLEKLALEKPLIIERLKAAALASRKETRQRARARQRPVVAERWNPSMVIAIGGSTGGTEALRRMFLQFPKEIPPVVVVQHIPPLFSAAFAKRLDGLLPFEVKEASEGDILLPNRVLIAPGDKQMKVVKHDGKLCVRLTDDESANHYKPSVDYLFDSVASVIGKKAIGILLTGMGRDGAKGLLKMRQAGSHTVSQDEETSVVYGMPRAAAEMNAVEKIVGLSDIAECLSMWLAK